ncbi:hypothetical protein J2I47_16340 [Fibrella sp. HMF5335]|uniref:Uncharacterized protein n=1 Tax=Fibrella rubiginis TaxID=2817060 RepID=A0A939K2E2_9BACT|nr:hypothetical protein [Fibrella rubiginis]MBO0938122.1 hypothetical protein [Fibrella rubiginis]
MPIKYVRTGLFLLSYLLVLSCSSPPQTTQNTPPDPAADSVADGLIVSDTTVTDDDTLETQKK